MELYRVLLADDEEEIREGIRRKIDWGKLGFTLVGSAENGMEALELAEQLHPDVVLTDIKMPYMDGLELCRQLKQFLPASKIVVFSGFDDFEYARQAIGMNVSEYILKPINAPELSQVLSHLREQLDQQRLEHEDMENLRRKYEESLPILRELFYTRLLDGRISPDQIQERAARYEIELPEGCWTVALVLADGGASKRDELKLLSIQAFFEKHFALDGCILYTVLYNETIALLIRLKQKSQIYALTAELERLCMLAESLLGLHLFVGVGRPCQGPAQFYESVKEAAAAADYRVLMDSGQVLYIGDLEPDHSAYLTLEEDDLRTLSTAVKLGSKEKVAQLVSSQVSRVREARLSLPQSHMFFMEIVTSLIRLAQANGIEMETVFGPNFTGMVSITDFRSLDELEQWLVDCALELWGILSRQRSDSAWKTVEQAKIFIATHYAESDLNVETLCAYLHLSPTYFSTLFKRETQKSFTAYVTDLRMQHAAQLLRDTDEKTYLIAERIGYTDPNYFSYVFKKHFGLTPSKYRAGQGS